MISAHGELVSRTLDRGFTSITVIIVTFHLVPFRSKRTNRYENHVGKGLSEWFSTLIICFGRDSLGSILLVATYPLNVCILRGSNARVPIFNSSL